MLEQIILHSFPLQQPEANLISPTLTHEIWLYPLFASILFDQKLRFKRLSAHCFDFTPHKWTVLILSHCHQQQHTPVFMKKHFFYCALPEPDHGQNPLLTGEHTDAFRSQSVRYFSQELVANDTEENEYRMFCIFSAGCQKASVCQHLHKVKGDNSFSLLPLIMTKK